MPSTSKLGTLLVLTPFVLLAVANGCGSITSISPDGGEAGTSGLTGHAGSSGSAGSTGTAGKPGTTGAAGTTAAAGTTGNTTGSAGTNGAAGTNGQAGTSGGGGKGGSGGAGTSGSAGTTGAAGTAGCTCNALYAPVCGVNGRTYGNSCEAACSMVAVAHTGACTDGGVADASTGDAGGSSVCNFDSDCSFRQAAGCCGMCMLTTAPTPAPPQACTTQLCATAVPTCACVNHVCKGFTSTCPGPVTAAAADEDPSVAPKIAVPPICTLQ